ncbi:MAG: hypothetical protein WBC73_08360, partial [Phormidesmis sp.]
MTSKYDDDYTAFPERPPASVNRANVDRLNAQPANPNRPEKARSNRIPPQPVPLATPTARFSGAASSSTANAGVGKAPVDDISVDDISKDVPVKSSRLGLRWLRSWPMVVLLVFGILGTVGTTAVVSLFRIPTSPNCRAVFWPTASASLRLQCAESYAAEGDVKNLLAAIALVDQLPEDHPLRNDINQRIEGWADQVLDLAENSFEAGELEEAIAAARKI